MCAQYRGRVFSVSGEDKRYPSLRDGTNSPLKNGYNLIHPNCRCEFRAYFETLHSKEENEDKRKFSNRPFEGDKRTTAQARAYQEWQTINRRAIDEQRRWNEMQAVLGKDMPYKDMGSLRRALRAEKDSFAYKKSHYAVRDYNQYKRWQEVLGEENMPKSLAEFQDLKYNDSSKYEELERTKATISEIEQKPWTPVFKKKAKSEIFNYKRSGIEFSAHGIARCLQRGFDRKIILETHKMPFNFVQPDGKLVKQYNSLTMIYTSDGATIVTITNKNRPKGEWNVYDTKSD